MPVGKRKDFSKQIAAEQRSISDDSVRRPAPSGYVAPKKKAFNIYITDEEHRIITEEAAAKGLSKSHVVRLAIQRYFGLRT